MRALRVGALCALVALLLGSSCPTDVPPLPQTLGAPGIDSVTVGAFFRGTQLTEAIHIVWHAPESESIPILNYSIFRKLPGDSTFRLLQHSRPATMPYYYDWIGNEGLVFPHERHSIVSYRVLAYDSLGRAGDTSAVDTVGLAAQPQLDSTSSCLGWTIAGYTMAFTTFCRVWDHVGIIWQSPPPQFPHYPQPGQSSWFCVNPPHAESVTQSFPQGPLYWAALVRIKQGSFSIGSIRIGAYRE